MKNPFLELTGLDLWSHNKLAPVLPNLVSIGIILVALIFKLNFAPLTNS